MLTTLYSAVYNSLISPLLVGVFPGLRNTRNCPALSDRDWLACGIIRTLDNSESGRAFLQSYAGNVADLPDVCPELTTFFTALRSPRRLDLAMEAGAALASTLARDPSLQRENRLQIFRSLDDFDIYAGDGHFHAAAAHDQRAEDDDKKYAVGHVFTLNLRSHALGHLCVADQDNRKKEHEMRALKRQTVETLRQGAPAGRKVLYVWDRAGIDFLQWDEWKNRAGIYFISRVKDNMVLIPTGSRMFDRDNPINIGVLKDEYVATSSAGILVRRVTYKDPATQVIIEFITTEMTIEPGLIAQLYRMRWDIEKVFDEIKNKLNEKKAWATSAIAKAMQAQFICMTHNLMTLLEARMMHDESLRVDLGPEIEQLQVDFENAAATKRKGKGKETGATETKGTEAAEELEAEPEADSSSDSGEAGEVRPRKIQGKDGIRNMVEDRRRRRRIIKTAQQTLAAGHGQLPFGQRLVQRITQRSVKFVRWLRSFLFSKANWRDACTDIARRYLTW